MIVDVARLRARTGTEFVSYLDAAIQDAIDVATLCLAPDAWGSRFAAGLEALALHFLAADARAQTTLGPGKGGQVVTGSLHWEQMGVIQRGLNTVGGGPVHAGGISLADDWLRSSSYGQKFLWLRSMNFPNRALP